MVAVNVRLTFLLLFLLLDCTDKEQMMALLSELKILIHLGQHLNIVNLLGAVTKEIRYGKYNTCITVDFDVIGLLTGKRSLQLMNLLTTKAASLEFKNNCNQFQCLKIIKIIKIIKEIRTANKSKNDQQTLLYELVNQCYIVVSLYGKRYL